MPAVCRDKHLARTGHGCTSMAPVVARPSRVFINGIRVARQGDPLKPHTIRKGPFCVGHGANVNRGSRTVFAHGIPIARIGDSADKGAMAQGSPNVFAGG
jgi:uncharacterized Zn-binding protein involved in type VI secretion